MDTAWDGTGRCCAASTRYLHFLNFAAFWASLALDFLLAKGTWPALGSTKMQVYCIYALKCLK